MKIVTQLVREPNDKTITFSELQRLAFCNSKKLPRRVVIDGRLKMWVGFGWIELDNDEATGEEPFVVEDEKPKKSVRKKA